jgi:hypothetical protein
MHCVPDCGFWPDHPTASGESWWHSQMRLMVDLHNSTGGLDVSCVQVRKTTNICLDLDGPNVTVLPTLDGPAVMSTVVH